MKCFLVSLEVEVPVWAETEKDAREIAQTKRVIQNDVNDNPPHAMDFNVSVARHIPDGWDDESIIYSRGEEITLKKALEQTPARARSC